MSISHLCRNDTASLGFWFLSRDLGLYPTGFSLLILNASAFHVVGWKGKPVSAHREGEAPPEAVEKGRVTEALACWTVGSQPPHH